MRWVEDRLRILPVRWMGAGLLMAAATGAGALALRLSVPDRERALRRRCRSIGEVPLATALLFDLGVFALVVGATVSC